MKKIIFLTTLFITFQLNSYTQSNGLFVEKTSFSTAVEYNNYLVDLVNTVDKAWSKTLEVDDLAGSIKEAKNLKTLTDAVLKSLKKTPGYGGEVNFKNATVNYASHMNKVSKKELPAFLKILRGKGEFTAEKAKKAEVYIPILDGKREQLFAEFENIQTQFAKEYGFTIEGK